MHQHIPSYCNLHMCTEIKTRLKLTVLMTIWDLNPFQNLHKNSNVTMWDLGKIWDPKTAKSSQIVMSGPIWDPKPHLLTPPLALTAIGNNGPHHYQYCIPVNLFVVLTLFEAVLDRIFQYNFLQNSIFQLFQLHFLHNSSHHVRRIGNNNWLSPYRNTVKPKANTNSLTGMILG